MRTDRVVSEVLGEEHALTPSDLYNAELKTNLFFGYSKDQVDALLERAADALETVITRNRQLKQQTEEQKEELEKLHDMEDSLRSALVSSQKMSENIIASARFQADALLAEAKLARAQAVFKMEQLPETLQAEIRRLTEARDRLRDDIIAVLKSHERLLDRMPRAEEKINEPAQEENKHYFVSLNDDEEDKGFHGGKPDDGNDISVSHPAGNGGTQDDDDDKHHGF
ncbi:MAG TPA: DivIVA domain-containing protein [Candidatus Hydrogenedentes bacterium]|nr:DivIVA domain-containing protein [Candidatus Hydrogenedentota bacterium]